MTQGVFVLDEFRLRSGSDGARAGEILATSFPGPDSAVPVLTSVADPRDRAILRAEEDLGDAAAEGRRRGALGAFGAVWQPMKRFRPRIADRTPERIAFYRLAVTELGQNGAVGPDATGRSADPEDVPASSVALLWIGEPIDSAMGLLVLIGYPEGGGVTEVPEDAHWQRPLGTDIGVRIYESARR